MPHYVDVQGISTDLLGYILVEEDPEFQLFSHKGDEYVLAKDGPRLLYVEDDNDAAILRARRRIAAPPKDAGSCH
jgi:hypothetical protein